MQNRCKWVVIALNFIDLCACMKCEFTLKEAELLLRWSLNTYVLQMLLFSGILNRYCDYNVMDLIQIHIIIYLLMGQEKLAARKTL